MHVNNKHEKSSHALVKMYTRIQGHWRHPLAVGVELRRFEARFDARRRGARGAGGECDRTAAVEQIVYLAVSR
jgi:hypothetical protein